MYNYISMYRVYILLIYYSYIFLFIGFTFTLPRFYGGKMRLQEVQQLSIITSLIRSRTRTYTLVCSRGTNQFSTAFSEVKKIRTFNTATIILNG